MTTDELADHLEDDFRWEGDPVHREAAAALRRLAKLERENAELHAEVGAWVMTCPFGCYQQPIFKEHQRQMGRALWRAMANDDEYETKEKRDAVMRALKQREPMLRLRPITIRRGGGEVYTFGVAEDIEVMPEWATSKDGPRWAYLAKRFAEDRRAWKQRARIAESRVAALVEVLRRIHAEEGKVCDNYELCDHKACQSSYGAWAIADDALHGIGALDEPR